MNEQDLKDNAYLQNLLQTTNKKKKDYRPSATKFISGALRDGSKAIVNGAIDRALAVGAGMGDNYQAYSASINKGLGKIADIIGWDYGKQFFNQNVELANLARTRLQDTMANAPVGYGIAGQILGDPVNFVPAGVLAKGGKVAHKTLKSGAAGAGMGVGTSLLRDYGDDSVSAGDMAKHAMLGGTLWGGMNTALASRAVDTLARKAVGTIAPNAKFADINARNARWAREQAQMNANPTAWYNREVAVPFAQDFRNLQAKFRPQQTTGNQVLDNVLAMTNPQRNSVNPQPPYRQPLADRPANNPNLVNMRNAFVNPNALYYTTMGATGAGLDSENRLRGFGEGLVGGYALKHGGKKAYKEINTRIPLMGTDKALEKGYANFSYETIPSSHLDPKKYPLESELYNTLSKPENSNLSATYENEVYRTKLFNDTAHKLGLKFKDMGQKAGYYTDNINGELVSVSNPSRQVQIKPEYIKDKNGKTILSPEFERKMQVLSAVMGKGLKQDAVTWHIPNTEMLLPSQANGVRVNLGGKEINGATLSKLDETLGKGQYGFIPDADGKSVRIIDFSGKPIKSDDIVNLLKENNYNVGEITPFHTKKMNKVRDNGYMGNQNHYEPNWQYSQDYYDDLVRDSANGSNTNLFSDNGIYPSSFGYAKRLFKGETAGQQWQDFIDKRQNTINEIGGKLREKPLYSQTQIPRTNNQKGFITPNVASHIATSGTGALIGASQDSENRLRGALIGAGAGLAGNRFIQAGAKAFFKNQTDNLAQNLPNIAKANPKLFNQIADRSLQGAYKSEQKGMREGFIAGENKANLGETHKANLAAAKTLEKNGANELEIWEKTGWYKDELDGKWKVEINPNGGDLNAELLYKVKNSDSNYNGKLSDILQDKELYSAYPQFRDINVEIAPLSEGQAGGFNRKTNTLIIGKNQNRDEALKTIYHEVQHAIQNTEGFSGGTNLGKAIDYAMKNKLDVSKSVNYYARQAGEAEARNVEKRLDEAGRTAIREGAPLNTKLSLEQYKAIEGKRLQMAMDRANHPKTKAMYADMKSRLDNMNEAEFANLRANEKYTAHPLNTLDIPRNERINMDSVNTSAKNDIAKIERTQNRALKSGVLNTSELPNSIRQDILNATKAQSNGTIPPQQPPKQPLTEAQKQEIYKKYGTKKGNEILSNIAKNQMATFATGSMVGMSALPSDGSFNDRLRNAAIGGTAFLGARNLGTIARTLQKSNLEKVEASFGKNSDEYLNALQKYEQDGASNGFKDISKSNNFLVNTFRDFRRYFSNTMSKEVNDLKDIVATRTNATSQRISQLENGLKVNFNEAERKEMGKWLMGDESVDFEKFNSQTQKFLQDIKNEINTNNQKLVELEHIDQKTADEFKDIYLTRRYEKDTASKVNDFFNSNYGVSEIKQRGKSEWVSLNEFEQMKADGKIAEYGDGGFSRGGKYVVDSEPQMKAFRNENGDIIMQERIKVRRDYTPQEREAMGEITDIAELLPKTLYKQNETIAHIEYLNALKSYGKNLQKDTTARQLFLDTSKFAKGADIDKIAEQQGFKKVNNKHFGALNGEYIRKDVYDDLVNTYDRIANTIFGKDGSTIRNYKELVQSWKKSKTIYNPKAHLNNIVSNEMLMVQYGLKPAGASYFERIKNVDRYQSLKQKAEFGKIKYDELKELSRLNKEFKTYDEAMELGLFGRGEIQDLQGDMIEGAINKTIGKIHKGTADKWNSFNKSMENWYQKEDHICRLSAYEQLKAKTLKGANRPLTQAEKIDIRKQVMAIFPDYTETMPKGIKALRDSGAVPFISWSYYVLPKMVKQMNTPKGATALAGILGTYYAGMSLMREHDGIEAGDDVSDNAGKYMPLPQKVGRFLRQDDNDDLVTRVKVDRAIPQLEFTRSPTNMVGSMLKSPLVQGVNDIINISTGKHPVQLFNNMPITRNSKPLGNRVYDYAKYGVNTYMPLPAYIQGAYNIGENRLMPQEKRRTNNVYAPRSFLQEVLNLVGVNTSNYSKSGARQEAERRRQRER